MAGQQIVEMMKNLGNEYDCAVIMATHDRDITNNAERFIHLYDGRLVDA